MAIPYVKQRKRQLACPVLELATQDDMCLKTSSKGHTMKLALWPSDSLPPPCLGRPKVEEL